MVIIGVTIALLIGGAYFFVRYRKTKLEELFIQVYETSKQVPKQKKNSFLLLMFKEAMSAKKKSDNIMTKLNNKKYLEAQMVKMTHILKDPSKVKDKNMKKALHVLKDYHVWEKEKKTLNKASKQKAS